MPTATHVVLGANGIIGRETVTSLLKKGHPVKSVGRRPSSIDGAVSVIADLLDQTDVSRALDGTKVAYLVAGLPYSSRVWAEQWPVILRNTIHAALQHGTHLVYFDNVYAYGRVTGSMTESTPILPSSRKGRARAAALHLLTEGVTRGLTVTIGRSADFYGPGASTSVFNTFALDKIAAGKTATWLYDADQPHSLSYTPDIGNALTILGTDDRARGQTWHLPTAPALTGREYLMLAADDEARMSVMSSTTMRIGALFNGSARETLEMDYQYTSPYLFDSQLFEGTFGIHPTPTADGIAAVLSNTPSPFR
ncbi:nucleoside-diphosphate-sugar epimerase [Okibacterium sp. HSC-33S16]|uniref:NAD-dependent epimerase/dehydratase family protein n=1 Tax=Okibacterium sp. HSC-33S16 TaxID=2910965 RepID=UPI0020A07EB6|nr:NAD-dependent epimerase/dehydratase family protein [Okibacterium sp. HSC-33S16]MCP2031124.1 nucleoside-diphosphate-sugar epimerase [Okibacterium sp. HSC-33S16]